MRQQFRVQEPTLDGFRIKGVENGDISKVDIIYSLNEVDTGRVVAKGQVNAKEALSARFYELSFNTIKECKGKDFVLSLSQISEDSQSSVNFSFEKGIERNTKLTMNREEIDGTLIVKTITKRFDLETFFVLMLFAVYIIFFIRLLYKLFK